MPTPSPADQYWELTTSTITHGGETLHRLRATRAIPEQGVAAGGWVSPQAQLSDAAWVADSAKVLGSVVVTRHALVCGRAEVRDKAQVSGPVIISDDAVVSDSVTIDADKGATESGRAHMSDQATREEPLFQTMHYSAANPWFLGRPMLGIPPSSQGMRK